MLLFACGGATSRLSRRCRVEVGTFWAAPAYMPESTWQLRPGYYKSPFCLMKGHLIMVRQRNFTELSTAAHRRVGTYIGQACVFGPQWSFQTIYFEVCESGRLFGFAQVRQSYSIARLVCLDHGPDHFLSQTRRDIRFLKLRGFIMHHGLQE